MSLIKNSSKKPVEMKSMKDQLLEQLGPEGKLKKETILEKVKHMSPTHKAALGVAGTGLLAAVIAAKHHKKKK